MWSTSRNILRRQIAHLEVAALKRDLFGSLLEQRVDPVRFESELVLDGSCKRLVGVRSRILLGECAREAQLGLRLRVCRRQRPGRQQRAACREK